MSERYAGLAFSSFNYLFAAEELFSKLLVLNDIGIV
jgi:hypothetical protein